MKGIGTDEAKLIEILASRTADQIKQVSFRHFSTKQKKDSSGV